MLRLLAIVCLAVSLAACTTVQPDTAPTVTSPEVTVLSDYPPVKAAVIPAMQALGYTIEQDTQFWTILSKPGGLGEPATRLTVTFASIRTHTRVIADTQLVRGSGPQAQTVPMPNHPDRARIQAALEAAKRDVERQPASARRGAPPPGAAPVMPGAPTAPVASAASQPLRGTSSPQAPAATAVPGDPPRPGATRTRVEGSGFRLPWQ